MTSGILRTETTIRPQRYQTLHLGKTVSVEAVSIVSTNTIPTENDAAITVIHTHTCRLHTGDEQLKHPTAATTAAASINKATPPTRNRIV